VPLFYYPIGTFPLHRADTVAPSFNITGGNITVNTIGSGLSSASCASPAMSASDGVTAQPNITCSGNFGSGTVTSVMLAPGATNFTATYTMTTNPSTFIITCSAKDAAGNVSPQKAFSVTLQCATGKTWNIGTKRCN
jgi:hypothetical protein